MRLIYNIDLLALRNAELKPNDPVNYLQDYFGKYRDPAWDEVDQRKKDTKKREKIKKK